MVQRQKKIEPSIDDQEKVLMDIYQLQEHLALIRKEEKQLQIAISNSIWCAQQQGIERAGDYQLVPIVKTTNTLDVPAISYYLTKDEFVKIARVTLKDANAVLTEEVVNACTIKTVTTSYKVVRPYKVQGGKT